MVSVTLHVFLMNEARKLLLHTSLPPRDDNLGVAFLKVPFRP